VLVAGVFARFVAIRLRRAGMHAMGAAGWAVAILCASSAPTLASVVPGRLGAEGVLRQPGEVLPLRAELSGPVRVLVSANVPEGAFTAFSLRAGTAATRGSAATIAPITERRSSHTAKRPRLR
jgi:hypothetical protein